MAQAVQGGKRTSCVLGVLVQEWHVAASLTNFIPSFALNHDDWNELFNGPSMLGDFLNDDNKFLTSDPAERYGFLHKVSRTESLHGSKHRELHSMWSLFCVCTSVLIPPHPDVHANRVLGCSWWFTVSVVCFVSPWPTHFGHATGEMTRPAVQSLFCAESNLWQQGRLAFQSQRPCQGVMRHNFLEKKSTDAGCRVYDLTRAPLPPPHPRAHSHDATKNWTTCKLPRDSRWSRKFTETLCLHTELASRTIDDTLRDRTDVGIRCNTAVCNETTKPLTQKRARTSKRETHKLFREQPYPRSSTKSCCCQNHWWTNPEG